jgi:hypothetical protein
MKETVDYSQNEKGTEEEQKVATVRHDSSSAGCLVH